MASGEILINQLFAGRYLSEEGNIGHEIVNLFKDDIGDRYLYITPSGDVKNHDVESVIFVRNFKARRTVEVVAVATGLTEIDEETGSKITYGGVTLGQIFRSNTYRGEKDIFPANVTYKADKVFVPSGRKRILISVDDKFDLTNYPGSVLLESTRKVVIPQGMRMYYSEENDSTAYHQLDKLIANKSLWKSSTTKELVTDGSAGSLESTYLEVVGKEDDEIVFSNLLAHYFRYSHDMFVKFAKDVLGIPDMDAEYTIIRESNHNIDIWIESENHLIVIENKLKSGINGLDDDGGSQLDKYYQEAEKYAKETGKTTKYYIFAPNYSSVDFSKYDTENRWNVIFYDSIYKFFAKHVSSYISERYFSEFLRSLERHTLSMSELNYRTMQARFMRKIAQSK